MDRDVGHEAVDDELLQGDPPAGDGRLAVRSPDDELAEQGFNVEMSSLRGIAAPKGVPPAIKQQLVQAIEKAANDPEFQKKAVGYYAPLRYLSAAEFDAYLKKADGEFRQFWKETPWGEK